MLSKLTLGYILTSTDFAYHLGCVPFRTRVKYKSFLNLLLENGALPRAVQLENFVLEEEKTSCFNRKRFYRANKIVNVVYVMFLAYRVIQVVTSMMAMEHEIWKEKLGLLITLMYVMLGYTLGLIYDVQTWHRGDVIPELLSEYIAFFHRIYAGFPIIVGSKNKSKMKSVRCDMFLYTFFSIGALINFQNFVLILRKPESLHFFTSILYESGKETSWMVVLVLRLLLMLLQMWAWANLWSKVYFYIGMIYIYASASVYLIRELNPKWKNHALSDKLREPATFARTLLEFRVLHSLFQYSFRWWYEPTQKGIFVIVSVLACYWVIKGNDAVARIMIFTVTMVFLYLSSLYRKFGLIHDASVRMREAWLFVPGLSRSRWMRRFVLSVPEFRVDVGNYYTVGKTTVFNLLYTILNGTITLLLGYQ